MPRQKNPKPQHHFYSLQKDPLNIEKEKIHASLSTLDDEGAENALFERSPTPQFMEQSKKDIARLTPDLIASEDGADSSSKKTSENVEQQEPEKQLVQDAISFIDRPCKRQEKNSLVATSSSAKPRRPATSLLNPKVMTWLQKRFELRENAKTSASEIIKRYEKEKGGLDSYIPLQSYQVGQLLRRIFPGLQRCKITVAGKRVWVYKHLSMNTDDAEASDNIALKQGLQYLERIVVRYHQTKMLQAFNDLLKQHPGFLPHHGLLKPFAEPQGSVSDNGEYAEMPLREDDLRSMVQRPSVQGSHASNDVRKHVKNSAILYNLLYPHSNVARPAVSTFRKISTNSASLKPKPSLPKSCRDESIIKWLRENYEYADGYFVKSLNVLKKYNLGRQTEVRYLSQVGRIIKYVFPNARHLRRSLKGGKREWIYHNIRPKDHTEKDVWKGSKKNLSPLEQPKISRPSLIHIPNFAAKILNNFELNKTLVDNNSSNDIHQNLSFFERGSIASRDTNVMDSDSFRSEEGCVFNSELKSESSTSSPNSTQNFSNVFYKAEDIQPEVVSVNFLEAQKFPPYQKGENVKTKTSSTIALQFSNGGGGESPKKALLEAQINRLKCEKTDDFPTSDSHSKSPHLDQTDNSFAQAEDLSMSGKIHSTATKSRSPDKFQEENNAFYPRKLESDVISMDEEGMDETGETHQSSLDHNYSYSQVVDSDLRVKIFAKGTDSAEVRPPRVSAYEKFKTNSFDRPNGAYGYRQHTQIPQNRQSETIQWEDLSICDAHRFGWTLTPTLNNEIPPNYIEWILFEGQMLRDGQRVFRELKVYDDWSVSIHALGKKVHPDELGGITDLSRTKKSISKVFSTLASARSCRGLPALSLSDLCVHGVVVAKTEIWSSRESNREELRHRAINCQVLYNGNEEACPKCYRVIRMHTQSNTGVTGSNEHGTKNSRFGFSTNGPM